MCFSPRPFKVSELKPLRRWDKGSDVVWLHTLLNKHLPLPDDQLPIMGAGADAFGPRTQEKVKRFQKLNRIDVGTPFFMDGVVGPHTWEALHPLRVVSFDLTCFPVSFGIPKLNLDKLTTPNLNLPTGFTPDPNPPFIPDQKLLTPIWLKGEPKLHLDSFQLQIGKTSTIPLKSPITEATTLSFNAVYLKKADRFHIEHQPNLAASIIGLGDNATYLTDPGIGYNVGAAYMPGSGKYFTWGPQLQFQITKSLTDRTGAAAQGSAWVFGNFSLDKDKKGQDLVQVTFGSGFFVEGDAPDNSNSHKWKLKLGPATFLGVTGIIP